MHVCIPRMTNTIIPTVSTNDKREKISWNNAGMKARSQHLRMPYTRIRVDFVKSYETKKKRSQYHRDTYAQSRMYLRTRQRRASLRMLHVVYRFTRLVNDSNYSRGEINWETTKIKNVKTLSVSPLFSSLLGANRRPICRVATISGLLEGHRTWACPRLVGYISAVGQKDDWRGWQRQRQW